MSAGGWGALVENVTFELDADREKLLESVVKVDDEVAFKSSWVPETALKLLLLGVKAVVYSAEPFTQRKLVIWPPKRAEELEFVSSAPITRALEEVCAV